MATYYIDPSWGGTASGTFALPWTTYASLPALSAGDKVLQKAGTTFSGTVTAGYSGTLANPIIYGVYAADGSEVTTTLGAATIAGTGTAADNFGTGIVSYVWVRCLKATNITSARYGFTIGASASTSGCRASYCQVTDQTATTAGIQVRSNPGTDPHIVEHCDSSRNTYGILLQGATGGAAIQLRNNICQYNAEAGIRLVLASAGIVTGAIQGNDCRYNGMTQAVTGKGIGIDILSDGTGLFVASNNCDNNYTMGIRGGTFSGLVNGVEIIRNECNFNGWYGIQMGRGVGFVVARNTCNDNGSNRDNKYGRGIECYSSNGSFPCGPGTVAFNACNRNLNYGGTLNNGTEGCGIGLDDNHSGITVVGNTCIDNEGSGIQVNPSGAVGANYIHGNLLVDNFNVDPARVAAGSWVAILCSQIYTSTTEANLKIRNNTFINTGIASCQYEVSEGTAAAAAGVEVVNNLFVGAAVALKARSAITRTHNAYWQCSINGQANTSTTALSADAGVVTADPLLSPDYRPTPGSPLHGAGTHLGYGYKYRDIDGKQRPNPPAIGAYDVATLRPVLSTDPAA
jgi:hypothetical protein